MASEERLQKLKEMEAQKPNDVFLKYAIALEYVSVGKDEEAKLILEGLLMLSPDYIATCYQLGKLYERLGENEKAIAVYQKGVELARKNGDKKNLGELNEAIMMLED